MEKKQQLNKFSSILFNEGEEVYASPYDYTSKKAEDGSWEFYWPSRPVSRLYEDSCTLVSINPLKGEVRNDSNVTAFRSFMVEMDEGSLKSQKDYIDKLGMPFSLSVFSGGKSLHYAIVLDKDLPSIDVWRHYAQWIVNVVEKADSQVKNPSRGIRIPGVKRPKKKMQTLVEVKGRIALEELQVFLKKFPEKEPKVEVLGDRNFIFRPNNKESMSKWVLKGLTEGFEMTNGRNAGWFAVGYEFGKCGYDLDLTYEALEPLFFEENTFTRSEWKSSVKNGHKKAVIKYWNKYG